MLGEKVLKNKRRENVLGKGGQAMLLRYICHAAILLTRGIYLQQCENVGLWSVLSAFTESWSDHVCQW